MFGIPSLDRFQEERYEKPLARCCGCEADLYRGCDHIKTKDGDWFCDEGCFTEWALKEFDAEDETLEDETV